MKPFKNHSLQEYLQALSLKTPVPGGGSVAALAGALGVALIEMVANYSLGKSGSKAVDGRIRTILRDAGKLRRRLLELVDLDAKAYLKVVKTRKANPAARRAALRAARSVPQEVCKLCYQAVALTPFLVEKGNKYLLSDIEVACEMLLAAYNSAAVNIRVNS